MAPTERLYYTDCYLREFDAAVTAVEPEARGLPAQAGARVYLDRTAFYPASGGQPADRGTLDGEPVLDVADEGDRIAHILARAPATERVRGAIDWARRFDHMQQHTGQHLLSAAFERVGGYKTVSFHLGAEVSTIDLDSDRVGRRQADESEELANRVIFEDRDVRISFRAPEEARQLDLRKPTERTGEVRLVEVVDFDLSACGGTHVRRTGAVGLVLVRKLERLKGLTRVEFVCGSRALRAARRDYLVLGEAARHFSGAAEDVPRLIEKQADELRAALRSREKLLERLAEYEAKEFCVAAPESAERRIVRRIFDAGAQAEAKMFAHAVAREPNAVALIAVRGTPATLFFAQTSGGELDMDALLKQTVSKFGGKGGGTKDFAQGGGLSEAKLEEALAFAAQSLA
jgi:alanyl-tRNA synthetase